MSFKGLIKTVFMMSLIGGIAISVYLYTPVGPVLKNLELTESIKNRLLHDEDEEKRLYDAVLKIPASDIYGNRDGYRRLTELNPGSLLYRQKLEYYQSLIDSLELENQSEPIKRNNELIDGLLSQGVISIDKQLFTIYVDTGFWNTMDYATKNNFCMTVNNVYTGYFLVDKYSGRTLANTNRVGEISILQ